ncbi:DUF167 family protein [Shewanella aestuarii]|uniref:DUF167 family protein n=1 Tax=Shewanella aestuarii TaxID=1028752 RepID=UPI003D775AAA
MPAVIINTGQAANSLPDVILNVYVQPKASRDQVIGIHGDELKVAITAPPVDGKANAHLIKFIAKLFKVAKSDVSLLKGDFGRHKQLQVSAAKLIPAEIHHIAQIYNQYNNSQARQSD